MLMSFANSSEIVLKHVRLSTDKTHLYIKSMHLFFVFKCNLQHLVTVSSPALVVGLGEDVQIQVQQKTGEISRHGLEH